MVGSDRSSGQTERPPVGPRRVERMRERRRHYGTLLMALALATICTSLTAGETTLAGISIGQGGEDIVRLYGEPADKDADPNLGSTLWFYPPDSRGTKLMFEVMPGDIVLSILVAGGPNPEIKTEKGVQLGDPIAEVTEAYGPQTPEPASGGGADSVLRYTERGALVFLLQGERVVQIDLVGDPEVVLPKVADRMVSDFRKQGNGEAEARAATGAWLKEHGCYPAAIAEYQRALALTPKSWQIMNHIGSAYVELKEFDHAREWFARGVAEKSDSATLQFNLGNVLYALGRPTEARPHLGKAVELAGESEHEVAAQALMTLGSILDEEGKPKEALDCYQRALKLAESKQGLAAIWYNIGVVYEGKGDLDAARSAFRTALSSDSKHPAARESLTRLGARPDGPAPRE
jgi:Flp pilus assembly protein TadD